WEWDEKYHTVGFRTDLYGDPQRVGIELRALNYDLEPAVRAVAATTRGLEDPKAPIRLNPDSQSYSVRDLVAIDRTDRHDHAALDPVLDYLQASGGDRSRWLLPHQKWETRPFLDHAAVTRADAGRRWYEAEVKELFRTTRDREELRVGLDMLTEAWAARTRL